MWKSDRRLMPHLHLSLQSGDDLILKRMKRRHTAAQVRAAAARARALRPDTAIGADVIAGFPTETDAQAANTLRLVEAAGVIHLHVFPFSARPRTPAARMPQVAGETIRARAAALRALGKSLRRAHLQRQIGRRVETLVERDGRRGHARDFAPMVLDRAVAPGALMWADVVGADGEALPQNEPAPLVPCRIATDWTIVAGTSNWGAAALAAAVAVLRRQTDLLRSFDGDQQHAVLQAMVALGPAVDGITRQPEATVDGLPFLTYIQPWEGIRRLLGFE